MALFGLFKKEEEELTKEELEALELMEENPTIIWNLMPEKAGGHAILADSGVKPEGDLFDDVDFLTVFPRDVQSKDGDPTGGGKTKRPFKLPVHKGCYHALPKGMLSKHRNLAIVTPYFSEELDKRLLKTTLGKALKICLDVNEEAQNLIDGLRKRNMRKSEIIAQIDDGEIEEKVFKRMKKLVENLTADKMKELKEGISLEKK